MSSRVTTSETRGSSVGYLGQKRKPLAMAVSALAVLAIVALTGSGALGGMFFTFSNFVMPALAQMPPEQGMLAMQKINVTVLNPLFFLFFMGTPAVCVAAAVLAGVQWHDHTTTAPLVVAGAVVHVLGCFLVTAAGNVPLNNELDKALDTAVWARYLPRWTLYNTIRTVACLAAGILFAIALVPETP
eukprot:m.316728 g.316728  ORF g.316728 m.316728 type:complete len:187 (+) comp47369_c0_seq1:125-685(+)